MNEFIAVLSIYYLCDATAALRPLSTEEVHACTESYQTVKSYFYEDWDRAAAGTPERASEERAAYQSFKAWEAANADLVEDVRKKAIAERISQPVY